MSESPLRIGADFEADVTAAHPEVFGAPTTVETASVSPLEGLRGALAAPVITEPVTLRVPSRPGVTIRCHTGMSQEDRKAWQNRSKKKVRGIGKEPEVDEMKFACLVIANTCEAVSFNGVDAHDSEDTPLNFRHRQLWDMVGARDPEAAIRALFGVDAHVLLASGEILMSSGFDDDLTEDTDPTQG